MRNRLIGSILAVLAALAFSPIILAQTAKQSEAAKAQTAAPTPDLTGVWQVPGGSGFAFTKETPPMQPWAEEKFKANKDPSTAPDGHGRDEMDPVVRCFPPGPTWVLTIPSPFEILQVPGRVILYFEYDHWVRQIWTDGRGHPKDLDPTWMGHSIGKWDGDTLVVDTTGLNDKTWIDGPGHVHSDALHIVERIRRLDHDTLVDNITFDDPKAYTKPWSGQRVYKLHPKWEIAEHVGCEDHLLHEHALH